MKKIKIRNILCFALIAIAPLLFLSGCENYQFYTKEKTNKTAPSFLYSVNNDIETFANKLGTKIQDAMTPPASGTPVDVGNVFDITDYQNDVPAQNLLDNEILNFARKINLQGLFASSFYQLAKEDLNQGYFDMSFLVNGILTDEQNAQLKNFFVEKESKTDNQIVYKYKLTGNEVDAMNLPVQVVNDETYVDNVDNAIKELGNNLRLEVNKQSSGSTRIKITPNFATPTDGEIAVSLNKHSLTDCRSEIVNYTDNGVLKQMVVLRYETSSGDKFTKTIEFVNTGTTIQKKITKYNGNDVDVQNLIGSYFYAYAVGKNSTLDVVGEYTINYDPLHSFISVYSNTNKTRLEYFKVASGELIGRLSVVGNRNRTVINVIIDTNLETGVIKYDYQTNTTDYVKLANEENLSNAFCMITKQERSVASTKPSAEILNYTVSLTGIAIDRANVIKE